MRYCNLGSALPLTLAKAIFIAQAIAIVASIVEGLVLSRTKSNISRSYDWRSMGSSLFITVGRRLTDFVPLYFALPGGAWLYEHRLFEIPMDRFWSWVLLFLGLEFFYYWFHRSAHRVRWFWVSHSVHHSPNDFNFSAAYRLAWTSKISLSLCFFLPLAWIGFAPAAILGAYAINLLYQFWIHAQWIPRLGWLEGIINTPCAHRVHHGANLDYLDANYGGVLVIFDRLFGTYVAEKDGVPIRYGWFEPLQSYNPFKILFTPWVALFKDLGKARNAREVIGYLFAPPGWAPARDGVSASKTTAALRAAAKRSAQSV